MSRKVTVSISGRKLKGYPTLSFEVEFTDVEDLMKKIDGLIENETDFGKVDVLVDDPIECLKPEEIEILEEDWIFIA